MQTILRSSRIPLRLIIIAILLLILGQPVLVTGRSGNASESAASQGYLIPAVIYITGDHHVHELALKGTWQHRDLTHAAEAPLAYSYSKAMAYQRSDGVPMVLYLNNDSHIHSLYLELRWVGNDWQEVWHHADLSDITGAGFSLSAPFGYVRSDGINAVVYIGTDRHIHEIRLEGGTWTWADLTKLSGAPEPQIDKRPFAYDRGNRVNAIVYASSTNNHIIELRLDTNGWEWADLTDISIPKAPLPWSEITAYVRSDGIPTINYVGKDYHIHDLRLETDWYSYDLTQATGARIAVARFPPYGYVRGDGTNAIVYTSLPYIDNYYTYELYLDHDGWHYYELTSVPNAVPGGAPKGYVRADGVTAVVYVGSDFSHIHEIRLEKTWQWADLLQLAGTPYAGNFPWPYNRSSVGFTYLPLIFH